MKDDKLFELKLTKTTLLLTEEEILKVIISDPEIFAKGIRRGKSAIRSRLYQKRNNTRSLAFSS
jgi:hypothetical protein